MDQGIGEQSLLRGLFESVVPQPRIGRRIHVDLRYHVVAPRGRVTALRRWVGTSSASEALVVFDQVGAAPKMLGQPTGRAPVGELMQGASSR